MGSLCPANRFFAKGLTNPFKTAKPHFSGIFFIPGDKFWEKRPDPRKEKPKECSGNKA
jgi:hypothetical protein